MSLLYLVSARQFFFFFVLHSTCKQEQLLCQDVLLLSGSLFEKKKTNQFLLRTSPVANYSYYEASHLPEMREGCLLLCQRQEDITTVIYARNTT